ncbi:MAG: NACHT domain-containing protein [Planctomycetes bacterium]|nr:NACHT domain-containing protein [Planctomycetota bacterium]
MSEDEPSNGRKLTWLHLSDLHACSPKTGWDARRVLDALRKDLRQLAKEHGLRPDLIFFTGDAAYGQIGKERGELITDQLREAHDFLEGVRATFDPPIPQRRVYLVPGNHDVNRQRISAFERRGLEAIQSLDEIEELVRSGGLDWSRIRQRLEDYAGFLRTHGYEHLLSNPDLLTYADAVDVRGVRVGVAGFNSAWSSTGAGRTERGRLWMAGRYQLETLLGEMPPECDLRIGLLHHPASWFVPEEASVLRQIARDFDFVLHGHEHDDWVATDAATGHSVLSAGACYASSQSRENGYAVVDLALDEGRGTVWLRDYEPKGAAWRARVIPNRSDALGRWELQFEPLARGADSVHQESEAAAKPESPHVVAEEDFEARYRKAVVDKLDYVQLFGIEVPRESKEYSLTVAYVSLNLADEVHPPTVGEGADTESEDEPEVESASMPAVEFFDQLDQPESSRLLIRGVAGCGKTTLLRWAAVQAGKDSGDRAADWRRRIPFLVRLRDYPEGVLPRPRDYPELLARELPDPPSHWVDTVLRGGRGLVMFDGVDEVPAKSRGELLAEIRQLTKTFPDNAYVVTTRPEAVERADLEELGFVSARVEPLSPSDRNRFIDRWHEAMESRLRHWDQPEDLRPLAGRLKARLDEAPAIARLATNPLLCAAVCALHRQRSENLPETPVALCEKLCEMLLERRDKERPGMASVAEDEQYRALDLAKRLGLLSALAERMVSRGLSAIGEADLDDCLRDELHKYAFEEVDAPRIRKALVERSGMLQESSQGRVEFLHNTLKEYLAATRFVNEGDPRLLIDHCQESAWQPTILFAMALPRAGSGFATKLAAGILKKTSLEPLPSGSRVPVKKRLAVRERQFFLFRCLATAHQIDDETLRGAFAKLSEQLIPPRSMPDAVALAGCGEAVVPHLRWRNGWSSHERGRCVRALALIGSPAAVRSLREYRRDTSAIVNSEFEKLFYEAPAVAVTFFPDRKELNLAGTRVADVSALAGLAGLQSLNLAGTRVADVSALAGLAGLRSLNLWGTQVADVSALAGLAGLRSLNLAGTQVAGVSALAGLAGLRSLNLARTRVADVSALAGLAGLRWLNLAGTQVADVSALAGLKDLRILGGPARRKAK